MLSHSLWPDAKRGGKGDGVKGDASSLPSSSSTA